MSYKYGIVTPYLEQSISAEDLQQISAELQKIAPEILFRFYNAQKLPPHWITKPFKIPTMRWDFHHFSTNPIRNFGGPERNEINPHKVKQLRLFEQAGLPVPAWKRLEKKIELPEDEFGPLVLIKSTQLGASYGRGIFLVARQDVEREAADLFKPYDKVGASPPIIQKFVATGDQPTHYRVITFMGDVIHSHISVARDKTPSAAPLSTMLVSEKVVSNSGGKDQSFISDADVLDLAIKAANLVPERSIVATDIIRESETGDLYLLEMNIGNVWNFSAQPNQPLRDQLGRQAMVEQYNVFDVVARNMAQEARRLLSTD